jgi:hypothetical protein
VALGSVPLKRPFVGMVRGCIRRDTCSFGRQGAIAIASCLDEYRITSSDIPPFTSAPLLQC